MAKMKKDAGCVEEPEDDDLCIVETTNCPFEATLTKTDSWRVTYLNSCHNHCPKNVKKRIIKEEPKEWTEKELFKTQEIKCMALCP